MDSSNIKRSSITKYFQGVHPDEDNILSNIILMKFRSHCFEKYINNLDEASLSSSEITNFFDCYDNLMKLKDAWDLS